MPECFTISTNWASVKTGNSMAVLTGTATLLNIVYRIGDGKKLDILLAETRQSVLIRFAFII